jgi:hypothetical protein
MGSCPLRILLLALGALAIHRSGLEAALFQPALHLVFRCAADEGIQLTNIDTPWPRPQQRTCSSNNARFPRVSAWWALTCPPPCRQHSLSLLQEAIEGTLPREQFIEPQIVN